MTSLMIQASNRVFGLITYLPENVMKWAGGGGTQLGEGGDSSIAKQAFGAAVGAGGGGLSSMVGSDQNGKPTGAFSQLLGGITEAKEAAEEKKKSNELEGGGSQSNSGNNTDLAKMQGGNGIGNGDGGKTGKGIETNAETKTGDDAKEPTPDSDSGSDADESSAQAQQPGESQETKIDY